MKCVLSNYVPVALFLSALLLVVESNKQTANSAGIPIEVIPGTNLLTGVYYRISASGQYSNRTFAILTYTDINAEDNTQNFVQIDDHEDREDFYADGGKWFKDGVWVMQRSEVPDYVTIRNAAIEESGFLVVSPVNLTPENSAPPQNYLYVITNSSAFGQRSTLRDNSLWKVIPDEKQRMYILENKAIKGFIIGTPRYGDFYRWLIPDVEPTNWKQYAKNATQRNNILFEFSAITVDI